MTKILIFMGFVLIGNIFSKESNQSINQFQQFINNRLAILDHKDFDEKQLKEFIIEGTFQFQNQNVNEYLIKKISTILTKYWHWGSIQYEFRLTEEKEILDYIKTQGYDSSALRIKDNNGLNKILRLLWGLYIDHLSTQDPNYDKIKQKNPNYIINNYISDLQYLMDYTQSYYNKRQIDFINHQFNKYIQDQKWVLMDKSLEGDIEFLKTQEDKSITLDRLDYMLSIMYSLKIRQHYVKDLYKVFADQLPKNVTIQEKIYGNNGLFNRIKNQQFHIPEEYMISNLLDFYNDLFIGEINNKLSKLFSLSTLFDENNQPIKKKALYKKYLLTNNYNFSNSTINQLLNLFQLNKNKKIQSEEEKKIITEVLPMIYKFKFANFKNKIHRFFFKDFYSHKLYLKDFFLFFQKQEYHLYYDLQFVNHYIFNDLIKNVRKAKEETSKKDHDRFNTLDDFLSLLENYKKFLNEFSSEYKELLYDGDKKINNLSMDNFFANKTYSNIYNNSKELTDDKFILYYDSIQSYGNVGKKNDELYFITANDYQSESLQYESMIIENMKKENNNSDEDHNSDLGKLSDHSTISTVEKSNTYGNVIISAGLISGGLLTIKTIKDMKAKQSLKIKKPLKKKILKLKKIYKK